MRGARAHWRREEEEEEENFPDSPRAARQDGTAFEYCIWLFFTPDTDPEPQQRILRCSLPSCKSIFQI
jgi:hypothetical protein